MKTVFKIAAVLTLFLVFYLLYTLTPLGERLDPGRLLEAKDSLLLAVQNSFALSALIFIGTYIAAVGLSLPGATLLTVLGGFLFGPWIGTFFVNMGAVAGSVLIFLASRYLFGRDLQQRYKEKLSRFNTDLEKNGSGYMLTLRLIPLFPFFLINILAGLTTLPLRTFIWTTCIGIIPGSFAYAFLGASGASLGDSGAFRMRITLALILLGVISLIPVISGKIKERKSHEEQT